jgi:hypothetical protein
MEVLIQPFELPGELHSIINSNCISKTGCGLPQK